MKTRKIATAVMALVASFAVNAQNAQPAPKKPAESTESKLGRGEPLLIGVRGTSSPFAYKVNDTYQGLTVDLCMKVYENVKKTYPKAQFKFVETNPQNRLELLKDGKIDLECGSTANTLSRRKEVDFSVPFFYAYVKAIKKKSTNLDSISAVDINTVVIYTKGTSAEPALKKASISFSHKLDAKVFRTSFGDSHKHSLDLVAKGTGTIFVGSDILLIGVQQDRKDAESFEFLNEYYQIDPFAIATRIGDSWIKTQTDKTMVNLMRTGEFRPMYDKWFMEPIAPSNKALNIPMGKLLLETFRMPHTWNGD